MQKPLSFLVLTALHAAVICFPVAHSRNLQARQIELINRSGQNVVVDWINPTTGEIVNIQNDLVNGQASFFDSFVNHTFAIHELSSESCSDAASLEVKHITVSENEKQSEH